MATPSASSSVCLARAIPSLFSASRFSLARRCASAEGGGAGAITGGDAGTGFCSLTTRSATRSGNTTTTPSSVSNIRQSSAIINQRKDTPRGRDETTASVSRVSTGSGRGPGPGIGPESGSGPGPGSLSAAGWLSLSLESVTGLSSPVGLERKPVHRRPRRRSRQFTADGCAAAGGTGWGNAGSCIVAFTSPRPVSVKYMLFNSRRQSAY